jgi:SAM-dependent methyltransferase
MRKSLRQGQKRLDARLFGQKYYSRQERAAYTVAQFGRYLAGSVLDVGSGGAGLCALLAHGVSVDISPAAQPDALVNLEQGGLPFATGAFETTVCTDVLEHLDNIHQVFAELARVSRRFILISLPNNWLPAREAIRAGKPGSLKYYGLPLDYPSDRHRWFFSYSEAERFLRGMARRYNLDVEVIQPYFGKRNQLKFHLLAPFWSRHRRCDRYATSLWCVLAKRDG